MLKFSNKNLIVYELNEVPERVLKSFVARHPDSEFAYLLNRSVFAETYVSDEGILSPWSTWPTLHRGVTNKHHTITDFGQELTEVDNEYPPIWKILAGAGIKVGMFGSLHTYPVPENRDNYKFYMPDTFAFGSEAYPSSLEVFQEFNLSMVDASARNVNGTIPMSAARNFLIQAPKLGIRFSTCLSIARQLISERVESSRKVRRRTSQMELAFDVFRKQLENTKPEYSCFFTNHVASSLHRYWPAAFPEDYEVKQLPQEWRNQYSNEIDFAMKIADQQLGVLRRFAENNGNYSLLVVSSMGQKAVDDSEIVRNQLYATNFPNFMKSLGLDFGAYKQQRAMLPRYIFQVADSKIDETRITLGAVKIQGVPLEWKEHENGVFMLKLGQRNLTPDVLKIEISGTQVQYKDVGLDIVEIEDTSGSYAYHIPQGILLHYDPENKQANEIVSNIDTTEIAPAIMRNFDLKAMSYMRS